MPGKKGMKHYPTCVKEKAVKLHLEEGLTTKEVTRLLGITDEQRVNKWCIAYRKKGLQSLQYRPHGRPRKRARSEQQQVEYELKRLRMENELLRNFLYELEGG